MKSNSRRTAAFIIARWLATHDFPNEMLPQQGEDRGFVQDLVYTVLRRFRALRLILGELMKTWPKGELEALVLVGGAQILYMPDVPDFAAVNETVAAAKMSGKDKRLDRVVNGVLRNLIRRREEFESRLAGESLATRESFPNALVKRWLERYGEERSEALAKWHNTPAETWLAWKPGTVDAEGKPRPAHELLARGRKVTDVPGYAEGEFIVQDPATAGAIELLDVKPGQSVLDFCAAPGGKTVQIAWRLRGAVATQGCAVASRLVAQEVNPKRLRRLQANLKRLQLDWVTAVEQVGTGDNSKFDRVLADVPCSNTGVLRRRPDARWRWEGEHLKQLVALQAEIFAAAAERVAPGGRLVYSTCSNEPEENEEQIAAFLAAHPDFHEVGRYQSVPCDSGHDGAFACALERT